MLIEAVIVLVLICYFMKYQKIREDYYDIQPYKNHWDIFSCYDGDCIIETSHKCYKNCDKIGEQGASENCRMRCLDYSDMLLENSHNYNRIIFGDSMKKLKKYSLLNQ